MDKETLRAAMRRARKAAFFPQAAAALAAQAGQLPIPSPRGLTIALYRAAGSEIDPSVLGEALEAGGAQLCLPVTVARDAALVFRRWTTGDPLAPDILGMAAPLPDAQRVRPDIVLTPLVAFDPYGARLGQGGGYYDRTLEALRNSGAVVAIGLAFEAQAVDRLPRDPCDQALDGVLTPSGYRRAAQI